MVKYLAHLPYLISKSKKESRSYNDNNIIYTLENS